MRAVILAGGQGTRLQPYTTVIPKPLVPVGDRPVLEHIICSLWRDGVRHIDICVSHLGGLIRAYLDRARIPADLELGFVWEDEPLGTAGALRPVPELDDTFIAMNGDILTTLDYRELVEYHRDHGAQLTIATHVTNVTLPYGVIQNSDALVVNYHEKPTLRYDVSMGIYVYEPAALRHLPPSGPCQFPDLVVRLLEAGMRVAAYHSDAEWYDIGTPDDYRRAAESVGREPERFRV